MDQETSNLKEVEGIEYRELVRDLPAVVIDVHADWCAPCKAFAPIFEKASTKFPHVTFLKANLDYNIELGTERGITSVPTTLFFKDGMLVSRVEGTITEDKLYTLLVSCYHPPVGV